jgi:16S rRNA (uracil1498-N3)-methyltransferase
MHRCYVEPACWDDREMSLSPEEEHHLCDVLRARAGETVTVFDGQGREATAEVRRRREEGAFGPSLGRRGRSHVVLRVISRTARAERPAVHLTLMQALPKGSRMDWIVEKSTELGVACILPLISERVVARLSEKQRSERRARWQRIALSAARQCGSAWVPEILPVSDFGDLGRLARGYDLFLAGSLAATTVPLHAVADAWRGAPPARVAVLVGPEGDFTPGELAQAAGLGALGVCFGPRVYRVETAALYALSVLAYEFLGRPAQG